MRTSGKMMGLLTLLLDVAKGAGAVLLGRYYLHDSAGAAMTGFFAMLGHAYPVFLGFRGGKSVATGAGAFLMISPFGILCSILIFVLLAATVRIVSVASIIASGLFPVFAWMFGADRNSVIWGAICAALIIFRHRPNIQRLIQGTEKKMGEPKNV